MPGSVRLQLSMFLWTVAFAMVGVRVAAQPAGDDATRATARRLGEQGLEAYWAKDYATAEQKLDRAFQLFATPTLGLYSARSKLELGWLVEAAERYREAMRASAAVGNTEAQTKAQAEASRELDTLTPEIPSLTILLEQTESQPVQIKLDGVSVPTAMIGLARPTNPGAHQIVAMRGAERFERQIELPKGASERVTVAFRAPDEPTAAAPVLAPGPQTVAREAQPAPSDASGSVLVPLAWVSLSAGGAALLTSGITALVANGKLKACPDEHCESQEVAEAYDTVRTVSIVSFYLGLGLAAGGLVMWLAAPGQEAEPERRTAWGVGPGGVVVRTTF